MPARPSSRLAAMIRENLLAYGELNDDCLNMEWQLTICHPRIGEARMYRRPGEWHAFPGESAFEFLVGDYGLHVARCKNQLHCRVERIPSEGDYSEFIRVWWEER